MSVTTELLHALAYEVGVYTEYTDGLKRRVVVGEDTLRHVIGSRLGRKLDSDDDLRDALHEADKSHTAWGRPIGAPGGPRLPTPEPGVAVFAPTHALHPHPLHSADHNTHGATYGGIEELRRFKRWAGEAGARYIATLPLLPFYPEAQSPYSPISRLFWSELLLPTELGYSPRVESERSASAEYVDALPALDARMQTHREAAAAFCAKLDAGEIALDMEIMDYAGFRAEEYREADRYDEARRFFAYAQYRLREEMDDLAKDTPSLYLDLPVGVHPKGFDATRFPEAFLPDCVAGAPPDGSFPSGQNWALKVLHPGRLLEPGGADGAAGAYYRRSLRFAFEHAAILRIDHVIGLDRAFVIPEGADGNEGTYVHMPRDAMATIIREEAFRAGAAVVGEDLGNVPDGLQHWMHLQGMLRMHVEEMHPLKREVHWEMAASLNTHDLPTFAAFLQALDINLHEELGFIGSPEAHEAREKRHGLLDHYAHWFWTRRYEDIVDKLHRYYHERAALTIVNLEDLWLETRPMNVPGTMGMNFRRRLGKSLDELEADTGVAARVRQILN